MKAISRPFLAPVAAICLSAAALCGPTACSRSGGEEKSASTDRESAEESASSNKSDPTKNGKHPAEKGGRPDRAAKGDKRKTAGKNAEPTGTAEPTALTDKNLQAKPEDAGRADKPGLTNKPEPTGAASPEKNADASGQETAGKTESRPGDRANGTQQTEASKTASSSSRPAPASDQARPPMPDSRLLMTMADVEKIAPPKSRFRRAPLAGIPHSEDTDSIYYTPEKGSAFGFALQLHRSRNAQDMKKRFDALQASYPASQEIPPVSGKTFFSYWDEVQHIAFVHPAKNLVVVVSCGRQFCDSDKLLSMADTIASRLK